MVLSAWRHLHRIRRDEAGIAELSVAQLTALMANVNRDPKKTKPFTANDFLLFRKPEEQHERGSLPPEVAAVIMALRHEQKAPDLLLTIWKDVLSSATQNVKMPSVRALASDDERIWVVAPQWEGHNIRGGLVAVRGQISGTFRLRDIDRPLATYDVVVPARPKAGWLEAGLLLAAGNLGL